MDTAEEALRRIEIHEAECKLMREMMEKRLDRQERQQDRAYVGAGHVSVYYRLPWRSGVFVMNFKNIKGLIGDLAPTLERP